MSTQRFRCGRPRRRTCRGGVRGAPGRQAASRSRWLSASWSAASARFTPACPPRRCCGPPRRWQRRVAFRAPPRPPVGRSTSRPCCAAATRSFTTSRTMPRCRGCEKRVITLVRGHGVVVGEREVRVGEELLRARKAVILAPGTGATIPPIPGLRESNPWTNREVTTAEAIPGVAARAGRRRRRRRRWPAAYASLGAKVTIVEALPRADRRRGGVRLRARCKDALASRRRGGCRSASRPRRSGARTVRDRSRSSSRTAARLPATSCWSRSGARPHTDDLGLETARA